MVNRRRRSVFWLVALPAVFMPFALATRDAVRHRPRSATPSRCTCSGGLTAGSWALDPKSWAVIGVGAFNLVRRSAYERAGTYKSMRLAVIDDLELGKSMKRIGCGNHVALAPGAIRIHWAAGIASCAPRSTSARGTSFCTLWAPS